MKTYVIRIFRKDSDHLEKVFYTNDILTLNNISDLLVNKKYDVVNVNFENWISISDYYPEQLLPPRFFSVGQYTEFVVARKDAWEVPIIVRRSCIMDGKGMVYHWQKVNDKGELVNLSMDQINKIKEWKKI